MLSRARRQAGDPSAATATVPSPVALEWVKDDVAAPRLGRAEGMPRAFGRCVLDGAVVGALALGCRGVGPGRSDGETSESPRAK